MSETETAVTVTETIPETTESIETTESAVTESPGSGNAEELSEFAALSIPCLNTDDVQELGDLTDHLIDVHGFTDILMLRGRGLASACKGL